MKDSVNCIVMKKKVSVYCWVTVERKKRKEEQEKKSRKKKKKKKKKKKRKIINSVFEGCVYIVAKNKDDT